MHREFCEPVVKVASVNRATEQKLDIVQKIDSYKTWTMTDSTSIAERRSQKFGSKIRQMSGTALNQV